MPSLFFTRQRTTSSKNLPKLPNDSVVDIDEFGRQVTPRGNRKERIRAQSTTTAQRRAATAHDSSFEETSTLEDGYLPTQISSSEAVDDQQAYGYLSHESQVVLGVEEVTKLVEVMADELGTRGLTTPFLLSNTALDISTHAIKRLVSSFLYSVHPSLLSPNQRISFSNFADEARFAGPHELSMVLRWGLARIVRVYRGQELRGLIHWDIYMAWRRIEQESNFDKTEFSSFLQLLPYQIRSLVLTLFGLLQRLLANSTSSGLTPPAIATHFGPLLFGLEAGSSEPSADLSFHSAYAGYLRACHATEHLLLAFVRLQIAQTPPSSAPPRRLISWVSGYPAMLAPVQALDRVRKDSKTVRIASVRRNVRLYSPDLVLSCVGWARGPEGLDMRNSKLWGRIAPVLPHDRTGDRMEPRYSDSFRKKMDLPTNFYPGTGKASSSTLSTPSMSTSSSTASTKSSSMLDDFGFGLGLGGVSDQERFRSLTDKKWGDFETLGFGEGDVKKLQFDLNESARTERNVKRSTLTWTDFSVAGFTRTEPSLSATLQFSKPAATTITDWPNTDKELQRKLKKTQKALPAFGWDTAPILDGREEIIEEGFLDCFCDLLYGGNWMDRGEGTFRDCNWALVELKSLPASRAELKPGTYSISPTSAAAADPRKSSTLILFEEFVPSEYRTALLSQGNKPSMRTRLPSLLSPSKNKNNKQWKQAATLNGRPYVLGTVPRVVDQSRNSNREAEFERLLSGGGDVVTKVITLDVDTVRRGKGGAGQSRSGTPLPGEGVGGRAISSPLMTSPATNVSAPALPPVSTTPPPPLPMQPSPVKKSRFKFPGTGGNNRQAMLIPAEYDTVDFETRLASYSDEDSNNSEDAGRDKGKTSTKAKRLSKDDAWVDILVASNSKRLANQDAEIRHGPSKGSVTRGLSVSGGSGGRSDPELASQEVAQALAAVRQLPPTDDEGDGGWDPRRERPRTQDFEEYEPSLPPPSIGIDETEEEDRTKVEFPSKRRVGYFDLHPERKHSSSDVQSHLPYLDANHSVDGESRHSTLEMDQMYDDSDFVPATGSISRSHGDVEVPAFVDPEAGHERESAKTDSMTLPLSPTANPQSKTAALIDLYRERERQQQNASASSSESPSPSPLVAPLAIQKPSRLPVRSLPQPPQQAQPPAREQPSAVPLDVDSEPDTPKDDFIEEPSVPFTTIELGRASPQRYVHGAPLHNVLEEEEE